MLSYLKDNQSQIPAASGTPDNPAGSESELSRQEDFLTVSGHGQKLRKHDTADRGVRRRSSGRMVYDQKNNARRGDDCR